MKIKIKNKNGYVGYVSLFTLFLIAVILIWSGFYGWQKYQEHKYPEKAVRGEIKGFSYYFSGIKSKIGEVLGKKDLKNKRAMELAEATKIIRDKANLYSLSVPQSWTVVSSNGQAGNQISSLVAQSSYFQSYENIVNNGAKITTFGAGAKLTVRVMKGEDKSAFSGNGGHTSLISLRNDVKVEGQESVYHIFREPTSFDGQILDDHFIHNGNTYIFRFEFDPQNYSDAEFTFQEILDSVKFLN
jgi:hypothetical protein